MAIVRRELINCKRVLCCNYEDASTMRLCVTNGHRADYQNMAYVMTHDRDRESRGSTLNGAILFIWRGWLSQLFPTKRQWSGEGMTNIIQFPHLKRKFCTQKEIGPMAPSHDHAPLLMYKVLRCASGTRLALLAMLIFENFIYVYTLFYTINILNLVILCMYIIYNVNPIVLYIYINLIALHYIQCF